MLCLITHMTNTKSHSPDHQMIFMTNYVVVIIKSNKDLLTTVISWDKYHVFMYTYII